eukprot:g25455.t1
MIPYGVTFTVFFQYGLPAIRMAAISKFPVFYIGTHDSIDLGEDGPTHQPVEVLPQLRAMPNLLVIRPADVNLRQNSDISQYVDPKPLSRRPIFLMTCRGELGLPYKPNAGMSGREGVKRGAYVVHDCFDIPTGTSHGSHTLPTGSKVPDIILIGSGQDVGLCMQTKELLLKWSSAFYEQLHISFDGPIPLPISVNQPSGPHGLNVADMYRSKLILETAALALGCPACIGALEATEAVARTLKSKKMRAAKTGY